MTADNSPDYFAKAAKEQADYYLEKLRHHSTEGEAYWGLLEASQDVRPFLVEACQQEQDSRVRIKILEILWEKRDVRALPFLKDALYDPEPDIWQKALDGLVTLASADALAILEAAMERPFKKPKEQAEFRTWLAEAIEQTKEQMSRV